MLRFSPDVIIYYSSTCQILAGSFLPKYLGFLIFHYRYSIKNSQKTAIFWQGQNANRGVRFRWKTWKRGGHSMSGCFLAKYLCFLIFRYRKTIKTGPKSDIQCQGQTDLFKVCCPRRRQKTSRITRQKMASSFFPEYLCFLSFRSQKQAKKGPKLTISLCGQSEEKPIRCSCAERVRHSSNTAVSPHHGGFWSGWWRSAKDIRPVDTHAAAAGRRLVSNRRIVKHESEEKKTWRSTLTRTSSPIPWAWKSWRLSWASPG